MIAGRPFDVGRGAGSAERQGVVRARAERVRPHQDAARPARRVAVGVRPARDADGSGAPAVRGGEERRRRSSTRRCRPRGRVSRWPAKRRRTPSSRAPFGGVVAQRLVSVGDYVTKGMKVAVVVRVNPLRAQLTIPEQFVSAVAVGQPITFEVDAYARPSVRGQGPVRVAGAAGRPARADGRGGRAERQRASSSPACSPRRASRSPKRTPGIVVPAAAVRTTRGHEPRLRRRGDHVEERIVTTGQTMGDPRGNHQRPQGRRAGRDQERRPARRRRSDSKRLRWEPRT